MNAMAAINAGISQVWNDTADAVVHVIMTVEAATPAQAHADVLKSLGNLPMGLGGEIIIDKARSVMPYAQWAEHLSDRCS